MENQPLLSQIKIPIRRPLLASFLASLMSFSSGTVIGYWTDTQDPESLVVFIHLIGAFLGALPAGQLSRTKGRKEFLLLLAMPMMVGWLLIVFFVDNTYLILAGRFLCGLSVGAVTVAVPLYNYDVTPNVCRGRGGVFLDFMLCAGMLYSYVFSSLLDLRMFALTCAVIPLVFYALFWHMPESPRYLYRKKRKLVARSVLKWLEGEDFDVSAVLNVYAKQQAEDDALHLDRDSHERKRAFVKATVLSLALVTLQRVSGAGAIIQYTVKLFGLSGLPVAPNTAPIITGVFQLISSGIAIFLVDRVGRRKLLLVSSWAAVTCLAMLTLFLYFMNKYKMLENSLKMIPISIVCTFVSFFRLGLGPIPWFITTELIGPDHTNYAQSCIVSYSWILSFVVMKTFVVLVDKWPVALWLGYTVISILGYLFILFFVPETNNKSADEIRLLLAKTCQ